MFVCTLTVREANCEGLGQGKVGFETFEWV